MKKTAPEQGAGGRRRNLQKIPTVLLALGAALMSAGLALVSAAAGTMLLGAFLLAAGVLMIRAGDNGGGDGA